MLYVSIHHSRLYKPCLFLYTKISSQVGVVATNLAAAGLVSYERHSAQLALLRTHMVFAAVKHSEGQGSR